VLSEKKELNSEREDRFKRFAIISNKIAVLTDRKETTQGLFDNYIKGLQDPEICKYMTGIRGIVSLCNFPLFKCPYRSREQFHMYGKRKFECNREKTIMLRKLL